MCGRKVGARRCQDCHECSPGCGDLYARKVDLVLPSGQTHYTTCAGACISFLLVIVALCFLGLELNLLFHENSFSVQSTKSSNYFLDRDVWPGPIENDVVFNFAFGLVDLADRSLERTPLVLPPNTLKLYLRSRDRDPKTKQVSDFSYTELPSEPCTLSELNLDETEGTYDSTVQPSGTFWPYDSYQTVRFVQRHHSELLCLSQSTIDSLELQGNEINDNFRELVIAVETCDEEQDSTCQSQQYSDLLRGKSVVMLFNERVLASCNEKTSLRYELEDIFDIDLWESGFNMRQKTEKQARFHSVRLNLNQPTETQMKLEVSRFEDIDKNWYPDRTQTDTHTDLFKFTQGQSQVLTGFSGHEKENLMAAQVVLSRDLDLTMVRRTSPSVFQVASFMGGLLVVLWLIGYSLVSCLTMSAYEDHMVSTAYSSKQLFKERVKRYTSALPESERKQYDFVLDDNLNAEAEDLREPKMDVSRYSCLRCICRCLYVCSCGSCQSNRAEKLFAAGRTFYKRDISVARLVRAMQVLEKMEDPDCKDDVFAKDRASQQNEMEFDGSLEMPHRQNLSAVERQRLVAASVIRDNDSDEACDVSQNDEKYQSKTADHSGVSDNSFKSPSFLQQQLSPGSKKTSQFFKQSEISPSFRQLEDPSIVKLKKMAPETPRSNK